HVLKRLSRASLLEMYPSPEELCITSSEGRFQHELAVPFARVPRREAADSSQSNGAVMAARGAIVERSIRVLPPGSDWLFLKLYGGIAALDDTLTTALAPLLPEAVGSGLIFRWFFTRYADPHQHLRIRFNGTPERLIKELLPSFHTFGQLLEAGRIWKVQLDTYEREIERYGGVEAMLASEDIFFADSEAVLEILQTLLGDEGLDRRWRIALLGADRLFSDCGFSLQTRRAVVKRLSISFEKEFRTGPDARKQIGDRFRAERKKLESLLENAQGAETSINFADRKLERRSARIAVAMRHLRSLSEKGKLKTRMEDLAASYVHMHIN